ncbi:replication initiation and membrane attachment family protein [Enterococcus sp. LJL90]
MENAWDEVLPKYLFQVGKQLPLGDRSQETLVQLYQPIIGASALALYFSFLGEIKWQYGLSEIAIHADLLTDLNVGLQLFFEDRQKLEAIGLLKSYYQEDAQLGRKYLYELQEPLAPEAFLQDSLLHFLLKEYVSETKYERLLQRFKPKTLDISGFQEVTKKFKQIFSFNEGRFAENFGRLEESAADFSLENPPGIDQGEDLDWQLIEANLARLGVTTSLTAEERQDIFVHHVMYGYEEIELSELLARTSNLTEQKISLKDFHKAVRQAAQTMPVTKKTTDDTPSTEPQTKLSEADQKIRRENTLKAEGFSPQDIELIKEAELYPPMTYFQALKEAKGGFIGDPEVWIVKNLVDRSGLPAAVVNILIHYVLVAKNAPVLNGTYVNSIANEWAQSGIKTPEAALKHARDLNNKPKQTKNYRNTNRKVRREKVPEWMNQKTLPEAQIAPERQAELDEMLKDFLKEGD